MDDWLSLVRRLEHDGEFFRAYDVAQQGLPCFPGDPALAHRAVLNPLGRHSHMRGAPRPLGGAGQSWLHDE